MEYNAIGLIEYSSIARGIGSADEMLKAAAVEMVISRTICSGKYMNLVAGDVDAVKASVEAGMRAGDEAVIDTFIIPNVHPEVFPALAGAAEIEKPDALGIIESFSVASLIEGADAAVKAADVHLIEIRLAMALGGKAFVTLTGEVGSVEAAVAAGVEVISKAGTLVNMVVIPSPREEMFRNVL